LPHCRFTSGGSCAIRSVFPTKIFVIVSEKTPLEKGNRADGAIRRTSRFGGLRIVPSPPAADRSTIAIA
jgi:hypothetical protein